MNKFVPLALTLAGAAIVVSACSTTTPGPGSAVTTPASPSAAATDADWGMDAKGSAGRIKASGLEVLTAEGAAEHFHAHLEVFVDGKPVAIPADIGFSFTDDGKPDGISALHTHDKTGIIHIEAPVAGRTYTLGQLLIEWGALDGKSQTLGPDRSAIADWSVAVNGKKQEIPVESAALKAHDEIVLYYGVAPSPLPADFNFPDGV